MLNCPLCELWFVRITDQPMINFATMVPSYTHCHFSTSHCRYLWQKVTLFFLCLRVTIVFCKHRGVRTSGQRKTVGVLFTQTHQAKHVFFSFNCGAVISGLASTCLLRTFKVCGVVFLDLPVDFCNGGSAPPASRNFFLHLWTLHSINPVVLAISLLPLQ